MSLAELIEEEKSLAAAFANATAVAKSSKAAHKAAVERLARYKIGYCSIWRSFATRLQIEKQKRQKLLVNLHDIDIREDVIRGGMPKMLVEVDFTHPMLSEIPDGTFGCGAPADEEYDKLIAKRERDIEDEKSEFDSLPKRGRSDDDYF